MKNVGARFRNRKINNKQLLHVYRAVDIPDLDESVSLQRSIPQTETGVDKEEESVSAHSLPQISFFFGFCPIPARWSLPFFGRLFFFPPFFSYGCTMRMIPDYLSLSITIHHYPSILFESARIVHSWFTFCSLFTLCPLCVEYLLFFSLILSPHWVLCFCSFPSPSIVEELFWGGHVLKRSFPHT